MIIYLCGCGALGSQIAMAIAQPGLEFVMFDDDRVGEENIGTSAFYPHHVGTMKAISLAEMVYLKSRTRARPIIKTLERIQPLWGADLIIDTFDNVQSRMYTCGMDTVHVGVSEDRTGAVIWDEVYTLPPREFERGHNPVCTHQLGRGILRYAAAVAAGVIERFMDTGEKRSLVILENLRVIE